MAAPKTQSKCWYRDGEFHEYYDTKRKFEKKFPPGEATDGFAFFEHPLLVKGVSWHIWHEVCEPKPDSHIYEIDVECIRSPWQVIDWTAHLLDNNWIAGTNWKSVLYEILKQVGKEGCMHVYV